MTIRFNNYAKPDKKKGKLDYFRWKVFVDEDEQTLDEIGSVEYLLHPTFPKPHQVRANKESKFALETSGWGGFYIWITVTFKDGRKENYKYLLDLSKSWPENQP